MVRRAVIRGITRRRDTMTSRIDHIHMEAGMEISFWGKYAFLLVWISGLLWIATQRKDWSK